MDLSRALSKSAVAAALVGVNAACASSPHAAPFAPTTCVADAVAVNGASVKAPTPGALVRFTSSGLLEIHGRGGSQVDQSVRYHAEGSGYEPSGFKGDFGWYDNFIDYDAAMDELLSWSNVSVKHRGSTLTLTAGETVVRCVAG